MRWEGTDRDTRMTLFFFKVLRALARVFPTPRGYGCHIYYVLVSISPLLFVLLTNYLISIHAKLAAAHSDRAITLEPATTMECGVQLHNNTTIGFLIRIQ